MILWARLPPARLCERVEGALSPAADESWKDTIAEQWFVGWVERPGQTPGTISSPSETHLWYLSIFSGMFWV